MTSVMDNRGIGRVAMAFAAAVLAVALGGCSLLTPSRADVTPSQTLVKLSEPSILAKGVLTVGLDTADAPRAMTDDAGNIVGYEADLARLIAERLGLEAKLVDASDPAQAGTKFDLYIGADSSEATDKVSVTGDVLENAPAVFGKKTGTGSTSSVVSVETLAAATVAAQTGSASEEALIQAGVNATQKSYANVNECFEALEKGEVQYVVCDGTAGAYLARAYADVDFMGALSSPKVSGVAMLTTNTQLTSAVTSVLSEISSDGSLDAVHALWFGDMPVGLSSALVQGVTATTSASQTTDQATTSTDQSSTGAGSDTTADSSNTTSASEDNLTISDPNANAAKTPGSTD